MGDAGAKPRILVVDDIPANLVAAEALFSSVADVVTALSGREALEKLLRDDFALAVLDVRMPQMDGFELAALIRQRPRSKNLPIVFLTAQLCAREDFDHGFAVGAIDYLIKPVEPELLLQKIRAIVDHQRSMHDETMRIRIADRAEQERASLRRHRRLTNGIPHVMWVLGADGRIDLVNDRWVAYTGREFDDARRNGVEPSIHPEDRARWAEAWASARGRVESLEIEVRIADARGDHRSFLVRFVLEREGNVVIGWIATATDIEELRQAAKARERFLAAASHELRTPLAAAKAQTQLLLRRVRTWPVDAVEQGIVRMEKQLDRLCRLADDLLDLERIELGKLSLETSPFDLVAVARDVIESARSLWDREVELLADASTIDIDADRVRIEQVLTNLLTNAVRYSRLPVRVRVSHGASSARIEVIDRGVGVAPQHSEAIFEAGKRFSHDRIGLGLGLAIARGIVQAHRGKIWVESMGVAGEGSAFVVELPTMRA